MSIPETENNSIEMYLAKICGKDIVLKEPKTRLERFLAAWAGDKNVTIPSEPYTITEKYLLAMIGLGENLYDKGTAISGYYINATGDIVANSSWLTSDAIPVQQGRYVWSFVNQFLNDKKRVAWFSSSTATTGGTVIYTFDGQYVTGKQILIIDVPSSGYLRFSLGDRDEEANFSEIPNRVDTRLYRYLNNIAGGYAVKPEHPQNMIERYLDAIEERGKYIDVEYAKSTGTQYIDTELKGGGNTKVLVEYCWYEDSDASGSGRIFGSRTGSATDGFCAGSSSGSTHERYPYASYDDQNYVVGVDELDIGEWFTLEVSHKGLFVNGVAQGSPWSKVSFNTPKNLKLFAFDNKGTVLCGIGMCRRYQRWDDGILIQDLRPAKDVGRDEILFYDRVSRTVFHNAGTGNFKDT